MSGADMRCTFVPFIGCLAIQAEIIIIVDRTVNWAAFILVHVCTNKGGFRKANHPGDHPRKPICSIFTHE